MTNDVNVDALAEEYYKNMDPASEDQPACCVCGGSEYPMSYRLIHGEKRLICNSCWYDAKLSVMQDLTKLATKMAGIQQAALIEMLESGEACNIMADGGDL